MQNNIKYVLKIITPIFIGIFCIYYSFSKIDFFEVKNYFFKINYNWVIAGIFLGALSHISRSYRWKLLLQPLGFKLGIINSILSVFSAYLINYTIPRAGDVARGKIISDYEKIPFEKCIGTIIAERIVDVICIIILILISLIIEYDKVSDSLNKIFQNFDVESNIIAVLTFFTIVIFIYKFLKKLLFKRFKNFMAGLKDGLIVIFKMKNKLEFLTHTIFIWVLYVLMFYFTSKAFADLIDLSFYKIMVSFTLAALSIIFSNGGIGIYPLAVEESLGWYGIDSVTGLAFGWVSWLSQTLMVIIFGGLSLFILPFINRTKVI